MTKPSNKNKEKSLNSNYYDVLFLLYLIRGILLAVILERDFYVIRLMKKASNRGNGKEKPEELIKLGKRIKELREQKGYTNYEYFAFENEINRTQWGRYENGEDLRFSSLVKVLKAFDMTFHEFFSEGFD